MKKHSTLHLRPHHILGYLQHEKNPLWYSVSDSEYLQAFRKEKGNFHNKKFILEYRRFLLKLHNNPKIQFIYSLDNDSICLKCQHNIYCNNRNTWQHRESQKADQFAIEMIPPLEFNKKYRIQDLLKN